MLGFDTQKPKSQYTVLSILIKQKYLKNSQYVWVELNRLNERGKPAMQQWLLKKLRKQVNKNILSEKVGGI